ncbi:MAG: hypothetical protein EON60_04225 [Alphaproteobacteria bacterium]|nr:MAG: hypothetical protein EON60_04225 [Alphaproteobacteria bacterium]
MHDHPEYVAYAHQYGYPGNNPATSQLPSSIRGTLKVAGGRVAIRAYRPFLARHTPLVPRHFDIDCTSSEASLYWDFLLNLLQWAVTGYPPERLTRDVHFARRA